MQRSLLKVIVIALGLVLAIFAKELYQEWNREIAVVEQSITSVVESFKSDELSETSQTQQSTQSGVVLGANSNASLYTVSRVVDGDTFKVHLSGKEETVRIVGINTPETVDPRRPVECFGKEASQYAKQLLENKQVILEADETQQDKDRYGRLLRFVYFVDGSDVGLRLIREGYAQESLYGSTPHKFRQLYVEAQQLAQQEKRGLWSDDTCVTP